MKHFVTRRYSPCAEHRPATISRRKSLADFVEIRSYRCRPINPLLTVYPGLDILSTTVHEVALTPPNDDLRVEKDSHSQTEHAPTTEGKSAALSQAQFETIDATSDIFLHLANSPKHLLSSVEFDDSSASAQENVMFSNHNYQQREHKYSEAQGTEKLQSIERLLAVTSDPVRLVARTESHHPERQRTPDSYLQLLVESMLREPEDMTTRSSSLLSCSQSESSSSGVEDVANVSTQQSSYTEAERYEICQYPCCW